MRLPVDPSSCAYSGGDLPPETRSRLPFTNTPQKLRIFLPSDSKEFVNGSIDIYKKHIEQKIHLDKQMAIAESEEAKCFQFSKERDKKILDKYTVFVRMGSAKDVLHIFSEDYEQLNLPSGAKSSTATQYGNRIIEFFKFMASRHKNLI